MQSYIIKFMLMFFGAFGVVVTTTYDFFKPGPAEFGRKQFIGFIVSVLMLLAGFRNTFHSKKRQLDSIMFCIYLLGMFYLVLMPHHSYFHGSHRRLLEITAFLPMDFSVNILGFFPFGYLLLSLLAPNKKGRFKRYLVVLLSGLVTSLLIEFVQYFLPGRTSSVNDVVANGIGSFVGVFYYHFESRMLSVQHK